MIALINHEIDNSILMAVFSHDNGFLIQFIDGTEMWLETIVDTSEKVQKLAKFYGFDLMEITIRIANFSKDVFIEDQSIEFIPPTVSFYPQKP